MSLFNKSALVTGATGGIGGAICEEFLKNGIKNLAVLDLSSHEDKIVGEWRKNFPGSSIKYFKVDVSSQKELEKCYKDFTKDIPSLDIVVNCAGICDEYSYTKMINVNLCGVIGSTLLAVEHMRVDKGKGKGGAIINIASVAGINCYGYLPTYSATKHGVVAFTRSLAHGRDDMGIKFLTVCPGATQTPLIEGSLSTQAFEISDELFKSVMEMHVYQSADRVSKAVMEIMGNASTGSVWIIANGKLTEHVGAAIL